MLRTMTVLVCIFAMAMLAGCKGKDGGGEGGKEGEKAAAKSAHDQIQGTWAIDVDRMIELDKEMAAQIKEKPEMKEMVVKMMGSATIEIGKDTLVANLMGKKEEATYTVKSSTDKSVTIESKDKGKDEVEVITLTVDGDKVLMTKDGDDDKMALVRK